MTKGLAGLWKGQARSLELVSQALSARHLFEKDKHYLIQDEKILIIDEFTGRVMPDRSWERGLHQMIEAKENVKVIADENLHDFVRIEKNGNVLEIDNKPRINMKPPRFQVKYATA